MFFERKLKMYKAFIKIEYECTAETADEAERGVLEECSYNTEIEEVEEEPKDELVCKECGRTL